MRREERSEKRESEVRVEECLFVGRRGREREREMGVKVEARARAAEKNRAVWMDCLRLGGEILSSAEAWLLSSFLG
jgi:hypothetical protein